jgi:hypothetical protein
MAYADPQILFIVTAIVIAALVVWVAVVLVKAPNDRDLPRRRAAAIADAPVGPVARANADPPPHKVDESAEPKADEAS